ncbi:hypothetical protein [Streptomyces sp. NPDC051098]|uniref:hypothetical protein n=1 Tax=Streptomyces sp. NPDC051098 TaxID=3155411 RepID=UPI0034289C7C
MAAAGGKVSMIVARSVPSAAGRVCSASAGSGVSTLFAENVPPQVPPPGRR